ncbi:tetratricopeptide repeat protein [Microvirga sp. Mcv34]|uniref:tetratricopeptide repeat protein n=1 Tax=Microvirga sp. Mcv34 TaxID=2926016 RepID=UPI0021C81415|nr:tetratricopeptide repeat protein [Microvirga sp. Mcv34]
MTPDDVRNTVSETLRQLMFLPPHGGAASHIVQSDGPPSPDPLEAYLNQDIDRLRDEARHKDPREALKDFQSLLARLPSHASGTILFRVKANIAFQHFASDNLEAASRWWLEAYDHAPQDPRAAANKILALWMGGDPLSAVEFGRSVLRADPANELAASYIPQAAAMVPEIEDGLEGIPPGLREREPVLGGEIIFLRSRASKIWHAKARRGLELYPDSETLQVYCAYATLDEAVADEEIQRTRIIPEPRRKELETAATVLDAYWRSKPSAFLTRQYDDAVPALANAMVAYHLLQDKEKALALATEIADRKIGEKEVLANAAYVALESRKYDLARRILDVLPDDPDLAFNRGLLLMHLGDVDGAIEAFGRANVPEHEKGVVRTILALAPFRKPETHPGVDALKAIQQAAVGHPRQSALVAQEAVLLGEPDIADEAYRAALAAITPDSHIAARLMVANYAEQSGSPSDVINLLDGYLPAHGFEKEYVWLAMAHAQEYPPRKRNLSFFEKVRPDLRARRSVAVAHATVLLNANKLTDAQRMFRRLHKEDPNDPYVAYRLAETYRRLRKPGKARNVFKRLNLDRLTGHVQQQAAVIQEVGKAGEPDRALVAAFNLARRHPDDHVAALSLVYLVFSSANRSELLQISVAGPDTWVSIAGPHGESRTFVIDEGSDLFGTTVYPPDHTLAALVTGKRAGDTFTIPKAMGEPEEWKVAEVRSKYLHLHLVISEEYELRYPGKPGLTRFVMQDGNVDAALQMVKETSEAQRRMALLHREGMPLAALARRLGGDPVGFAWYLRSLGEDVRTCVGAADERIGAFRTVDAGRGKGVVLDPYTTWIAAELDLFSVLREWFGTVYTPASTLRMADRMKVSLQERYGGSQMTMGWRDGQFYRDDITPERIAEQISVVEAAKEKIEAGCQIETVLLPDDLAPEVRKTLDIFGSRFFDAAFLAKEKGCPLLSDDLNYRVFAWYGTRVAAIWLQAVLYRMNDRGHLGLASYARAVIGLAGRCHSFVTFDADLLQEVLRQAGDELWEFKAVSRYVGFHDADMKSHVEVVGNFIDALWTSAGAPCPKARQAVSILLDDLLRNHCAEWGQWVAMLLYGISGNKPASLFIQAWVRGRLLPWDVLEQNVSSLAHSLKRPRLGAFVKSRHKQGIRFRLKETAWRNTGDIIYSG